jgi:hypothetical protein
VVFVQSIFGHLRGEIIWPCNVNGCPHEAKDEQHAHLNIRHGGEMSSGLGQIDF